MNVADALALATENGWSDDTAWSRSTIEAQASVERDGFLAGFQVFTTGKISWSVCHLAGKARSQRGTATSVEHAVRACDEAIAAQTGALF